MDKYELQKLRDLPIEGSQSDSDFELRDIRVFALSMTIIRLASRIM